MRLTDSLHYMIVFSLLLHVAVLGVSSAVMKRRHPVYVPGTYKVKIITPPAVKRRMRRSPAGKAAPVKKTAPRKTAGKQQRTPGLSPDDIRMIEERISYLKSRKKVEDIVKLESTIDISVRKVAEREEKGESAEHEGNGVVADRSGGSILDSYIETISRQIREKWVYPSIGTRDMVTEVAVRITRDGRIRVLGIERSSGNGFFDRSVLRAINKASPVSRPPFEMEFVLRFHPWEE